MTRSFLRTLLFFAVSICAVAQQVSFTGSMSDGRYYHTLTVLSDGRALVTGGWDNSSDLSTAELYDPATQAFTLTGSMTVERNEHAATLLNNGTVLITGGMNSNNVPLSSAELYNPATGTFTLTGGLNTTRHYHTSTLLPNGMVLITGGMDEWGNILDSAEFYDPSIGVFNVTGSMNSPRKLHTATLLSNGTVLLTGGTSGWGTDSSVSSAEIYDPATGIFTATGSLSVARSEHAATLLASGKALIIGGWDPTFNAVGVSEIYDSVAGTFTTTGNLAMARGDAIAVTLNDGTVLVGGGWDSNFTTLTSLELYDPVAGSFTATGSLHTERGLADAALLSSGFVLIAGGLDNNSSVIASAELYQPAGPSGPPLPNVSGLSPLSGPVGQSVTIAGSNFGPAQGGGTVLFSGSAAQVTAWSNSSITAIAPLGLNAGQIASVTVTTAAGNSNPANFTITGCKVSPQSVSMLVGQSRGLSVLDVGGQPATGIHWNTTDSTIAALSTDDPPLIQALAAGTATVYACDVPVAITVYPGTGLPVGTPIWSVPVTSGANITSLVPAVPSDSGADVFALDDSGTLTAVASDGTKVWSVSGIPGSGSAKIIPDFAGNALVKTSFSYLDAQGSLHSTHKIQKADPATGQLADIYTFSDVRTNPSTFSDASHEQAAIPHPGGTLIIQDHTTALVLDSASSQQIGSATVDSSTSTVQTPGGTPSSSTQAPLMGQMIVAGDGNAYLPYVYNAESQTYRSSNNYDYTLHNVTHLMLLRLSPDGTSAKTELRSWTSDSDCSPWAPSGVDPNSVTFGFHCTSTSSLPVFGGDNQKSSISVITNSDQSAAVFATQVPSGCSDALYAEYFVDSQLQVYQQNTGCSDTQAHMLLTYVAQDAVTSQLEDALVFPNNTGMLSGFWPALQREDASYIGTDGDNHLVAVAATGKVWQQSIAPDPSTGLPTPVKPLYATADAGVIVTSTTTDANGTTHPGTLFTLDQSGNVIGQSGDLGARYSWRGDWYGRDNSGQPVALDMGGSHSWIQEGYSAGLFDSEETELRGLYSWQPTLFLGGNNLTSFEIGYLSLAASYAAAADGNIAGTGAADKSLNSEIREAIARVAKAKLGSDFWRDTDLNHCNIFVHDMIKEVHDTLIPQAPLPPESDKWGPRWRMRHMLGQVDSTNYPAQAGDWANPNKTLGCWKAVSVPVNSPAGTLAPDLSMPGDVIAEQINYDDATGHVGIIVDSRQTASADSTTNCDFSGLPQGLITITDFGFRAPNYQRSCRFLDSSGTEQLALLTHGKKKDSVVKRFTCN